MLGVLPRFCPIIVQVTPLKTPFGLVTPFITIPITRSCNHTQLLLTPLHNYNPCAFVPTITYRTVTLLTINALCCRSSILRLDSFFSCQLLTDCLRRLAHWLFSSLSGFNLRWPFSDRVEVTWPNRSEMHSHGLVAEETSSLCET
jgi:hypothetical protein